MHPELGTLEWITFNPNSSIRISTVETFNFSPSSTLFSLSFDIRTLFSPMREQELNGNKFYPMREIRNF